MRITEKHLKEFFPKDMRFTHYVAKINGFRFKDKWAVEKANSLAMYNVLSMYNKGREFDDEKHLYGIVISSFRYAILSSFTKTKVDKLPLNVESETINNYGYGEYSQYEAMLIDDQLEYDNTAELISQTMIKELSDFDGAVFKLLTEKSLSPTEISKELDVPYYTIDLSRRRIKSKLNSILRNEKNRVQERKQSAREQDKLAVRKSNIETRRRLREKARRERAEEKKRQGARSSEAMSWLDIK